MEEENITIQQKESIKLTRGLTGKVGWEIKVLGDSLNFNKIGSDTIKNLENLDKELKEKFGVKE